MPDAIKLPNLTVAVVNYNGRPYLAETIRAVQLAAPSGTEIAIVDNASTDDSRAFVESEFPEVQIWAKPANDGPGHARNLALAKAKSRHVLLLDNDVSPEPECIDSLFEGLQQHPSASVALTNIVYHDQNDITQFAGAASHFLGTVIPLWAKQPREACGNVVFTCSSLISSALLVDRERLGNLTLFNEDLFIYFEDHEAGLRCNIAGQRIICVPHATCRHREGSIGLSVRQTGEVKPIRIQQSILNRWYVLMTLYQKRTLARFLPALVFFEAVQLGGAIANGWTPHWLWAAKELFARRKRIFAQRAEVRRIRLVPDSQILEGGSFPFNRELKSSKIQALGQGMINVVCHINWSLTGPKNHSRNGE
ncbi:glycosyltransferase [Pelagicoccus sp. SDUM812002]|uniref:glycosyltransferase n=1 Tax=Pelagicoccus sp. SDUM812002 TaxID=3041266 RepID=UPI00280DAAE7|nr:glycosyltransferase [Pelagicoccus sp. SDUM812002]MDQ8186833.1 glycosyltransferase [Pelagicoccus sp. SDUM812002]